MSQTDEFDDANFQAEHTGQTLLRILKLARPHVKMVATFISAIACVSIIDAVFTYIGKLVIDTGIAAGSRPTLYRLFTIYGGLTILQALLVLVFIFMVGILGERIRYDLRRRMFEHLQKLSLSYYSRTPVGWIMARVTSDSDRVADLMTWALLDSSWAVINITTASYFMLLINWKLALIVLVTIPILLYLAILFRKAILLQYRNVRRFNSKITAAFNENITGVRVVKALGREDQNLVEFSGLTGGMFNAAFRAAWLSAMFLPTVQVVSAMALGAVIWFGGKQIELGGITVGGIQAFVGYITFMMWPIQDVARIFAEAQHAIASAERIFSLVDTIPEVSDRENALAVPSLAGDIRFDKVSFYYEEDKPVIADLDFTVKQGETIALVGPTGGGKTTIVNLICRFYEPRQGVIYFGEHDYTQLALTAIQSRIGIVLQTPHLFSGNILENIRYGRLNATDEEVIAAAHVAGAFDFIQTFEKKFLQEVGEGGNMLSVGQKQLISLARAVLADPQIFIMDEATSSVDTLTEAMIQRGMEALMKGRTSFIIAHRLSTIKRADRIMVIDNGHLQEEGSHTQLMQQRGKYYRLYTQQFRHELESELDTETI